MGRKKQEFAATFAAKRPMPPDSMFTGDAWPRRFVPAPEVSTWVTESFLAVDAPLHNDDHRHLFFADVGYLWVGVLNQRKMRRVVGECEQVMFRTSGWQRARQEEQIEAWFGRIPDFIITLDALYAREATDLQWCALVEHELYHIGQRLDEFGAPAFTKDGIPKLGIRGHDVEEFVGIVRRYGTDAGAGDTAKFIAAAARPPEVGQISIAHACGTCMLRAA